MEREALKLALEALENISGFAVGEGDVCEIIAKRARLAAKALEEALAQPPLPVQPKQEPIPSDLRINCTVKDDANPSGISLEEWQGQHLRPIQWHSQSRSL